MLNEVDEDDMEDGITPGLSTCGFLAPHNLKRLCLGVEQPAPRHRTSVNMVAVRAKFDGAISFRTMEQLRGTAARTLLDCAAEQGLAFDREQANSKLQTLFRSKKCALLLLCFMPIPALPS